MKISVITACRNSEDTIGEALESVFAQTHRDVEYIVVDGGSKDGTVEILRRYAERIQHLTSEPDRGVYDAMNKGLALATGDVVGFLNSDDIYVHSGILARVAAVMADPAIDGCYADLFYVKHDDGTRAVRRWVSRPYAPGLFRRGWMPPHPTFFVRRACYEKFGGFDTQLSISADFELAMRFLHVHGVRTRYVPETWVRMRMGGLSNSDWRTVLRTNIQTYRACRKHGLSVTPWFVIAKIASRIPQFFVRDR